MTVAMAVFIDPETGVAGGDGQSSWGCPGMEMGPWGPELAPFGVPACSPGSSGIEDPGGPPCNIMGPGPRPHGWSGRGAHMGIQPPPQ